MSYTEAMFRAETKLAEAEASGNAEEADRLARSLEGLGAIHCSVCGGLVRFHHLDGWIHDDAGMDHDARPDRFGFEWPSGLRPPGTKS